MKKNIVCASIADICSYFESENNLVFPLNEFYFSVSTCRFALVLSINSLHLNFY